MTKLVEEKKGFTLLEIIIVLAVMAILAGIAVPYAYRQIASSRQQATREEMINLKRAIIGDERRIQNGRRSDFGYLGDWGNLPGRLDALVRAQSPRWYYDKKRKIGAGWNGPYISDTFSGAKEDYRLDAWQDAYIYSNRVYTNKDGELVDGKIMSWGPDGKEGGGDDLVLEILRRETHSRVFGYVRHKDGEYVPHTLVTICFPKDGKLIEDTCRTDMNGYFEFNAIPFGLRSIAANGGSFWTICIESPSMQVPDIYVNAKGKRFIPSALQSKPLQSKPLKKAEGF